MTTLLTVEKWSSKEGKGSSINRRRQNRLPRYEAPPNDTQTPPRMKKAGMEKNTGVTLEQNFKSKLEKEDINLVKVSQLVLGDFRTAPTMP